MTKSEIEIEYSTSPARERAALEAAMNFVAGYLLALQREASVRVWAAKEPSLKAVESGIVVRLGELSKTFHVETRERHAG